MKNAKTLIVLVAVIALLVGAYFVVSSGILEKKPEPVKTVTENRVIFDYNRELKSLTITRKDGTLTFDNKLDKWVCREYPNYPMDKEKLDGMGSYLTNLTAVRILDKNDPAFGIDDGATVVFILSDGTESVVHIGVVNTATTDYYAGNRDMDRIFTIPGEGAEKFYGDIMDFVLLPENEKIPYDTVNDIKVNGVSRKDQAADFANALNVIYTSSCASPYTENFDAYGLTNAKWTVETDFINENGIASSYVFWVGDQCADMPNYRYVRLSAYPNAVYRCFSLSIEDLMKLLEG